MNGLETLEEIFKDYGLANNFNGDFLRTDIQEEKLEPIKKELKTLEIIGKYVDVGFERTSAGKPIMLIRNRRFGQGWLIHISEEDYGSVGETNKEENE